MIHVKQHIPAFVSGVTPKVAAAATTAELLKIPWIRHYAKEPGFHRFSVSDDKYLMLEQDGGAKWWVLGYLHGDPVDLPRWDRP